MEQFNIPSKLNSVSHAIGNGVYVGEHMNKVNSVSREQAEPLRLRKLQDGSVAVE